MSRCVHNPFVLGTTVCLLPGLGADRIACTVCNSFMLLARDSVILQQYEEPPQVEDSPQLRIAEFEQVSTPPADGWSCRFGKQHACGDPCECDA